MINIKTYVLDKFKTRYVALSEARKVIPTISIGAIIKYEDNKEMIVCNDNRIAVIKQSKQLKWLVERISI